MWMPFTARSDVPVIRFWVGIRVHFHRPVIGTDEHRFLFGKPFRGIMPMPGRFSHIGHCPYPITLTGVYDDGIAGLQREFWRQGILQIWAVIS
jgi:hypothetical protein